MVSFNCWYSLFVLYKGDQVTKPIVKNMLLENKKYSYLIAYTISLNAIDTKTMTSTTDEYNKSQPINRLMFRIL